LGQDPEADVLSDDEVMYSEHEPDPEVGRESLSVRGSYRSNFKQDDDPMDGEHEVGLEETSVRGSDPMDDEHEVDLEETWIRGSDPGLSGQDDELMHELDPSAPGSHPGSHSEMSGRRDGMEQGAVDRGTAASGGNHEGEQV
jgi:hypothetical protein